VLTPATTPPLNEEELEDVGEAEDGEVEDGEVELTEVALSLEDAEDEELTVVERQCVNVLLASEAWSLDTVSRVYS